MMGITVRRDRLAYLGLFIIVVIFLSSSNINFLGSDSETLIPYEPPLKAPPADHTTEKDLNTPPHKIGTAGDPPKAPDTDKDKDTDAASQPSAIETLTTIPDGAHVEGFTILDQLYLRNGTFYLVTSDVSKFPPVRNMLSQPLEMAEGFDPEPTGQVCCSCKYPTRNRRLDAAFS